MSSDRKKEPLKKFTDKLRPLIGQPDLQKIKNGLPPKARFSIWYLLLSLLFFSYLQQSFFSSKVETIPYSQLKKNIAAGKVAKLIIIWHE